MAKQVEIKSIIEIVRFEELSAIEQQLIENAKNETNKAYAPYSNFHVGASVLLENGAIFSGSNQENSAYPSGLCAERVALFFANAQHPDVAVKTIAIAAFTGGNFLAEPITPCGACRQVLLESENRFERDIQLLLYGSNQIVRIKNIKQLLPLCFDKRSLNQTS